MDHSAFANRMRLKREGKPCALCKKKTADFVGARRCSGIPKFVELESEPAAPCDIFMCPSHGARCPACTERYREASERANQARARRRRDAYAIEGVVRRFVQVFKKSTVDHSGIDVGALPDLEFDAHQMLLAVHARTPLRLEDLRLAREPDLLHDMLGILRHGDSATGELGGFFMPRYLDRQVTFDVG